MLHVNIVIVVCLYVVSCYCYQIALHASYDMYAAILILMLYSAVAREVQTEKQLLVESDLYDTALIAKKKEMHHYES